MREFKEKVQNLITKYEERLLIAGIKISFSKRYFETEVENRNTYSTDPIIGVLNWIEFFINEKREKKKYRSENNKYHSIVLTVSPKEKGMLPKAFCKEYSFVIRKVERAHIGLEPERIVYAEEKVLKKIEKRILKIIDKAQKNSAEKVCKDTCFDAFRYIFNTKYKYKTKILGKSFFFWEMVYLAVVVGIATVIIFIAWAVGYLF